MNYAGKPFAATGAFDVPGLLSNKADGTLDVNPERRRAPWASSTSVTFPPGCIAGLAPEFPARTASRVLILRSS